MAVVRRYGTSRHASSMSHLHSIETSPLRVQADTKCFHLDYSALFGEVDLGLDGPNRVREVAGVVVLGPEKQTYVGSLRDKLCPKLDEAY